MIVKYINAEAGLALPHLGQFVVENGGRVREQGTGIMGRTLRMRAATRAVAAGLAVFVAQASAHAQSGWWSEPLAPPPPPGPIYVEPPPVIYGDPPPGYGDPPPGYEPGPYDEALPDGWDTPQRRGRLVVGPDGTYLVEPLPEYGWGDEDIDLPPDEAYPENPRSRARVNGEGEARYSNRRPSAGGDPDQSYINGYADLPRLEPPTRPALTGAPRLESQLQVLADYAPAKRAALATADLFARADAVRRANAWLVSASVQPATEATLRGLDRVLGLDVTDPQTTALPGAGTPVERPKVKRPEPVGKGPLARLAAYADARGAAALEPAGSPRDQAIASAAGLLVASNGSAALDRDEVDGIDAFLGFAPEQALVRAPADETAPGEIR